MLSMGVMGELIDRYVALFGPMAGSKEVVAREWQRQLGDLDLGDLHRALDTLARRHEGQHRPRIAQIRVMAQGLAGEIRAVDGEGTEFCSRCKTHYWYAGYELAGVVKPRLRCKCPVSGSGWHTEAALAWVEDDGRFLRDGYRPPTDGAAA